MKNLSFVIFRVFSFLIGVLPFSVLYLFSKMVAFLLNHVIAYRKKVIKDNIKGSFPDYNEKRITSLVNEYYLALSDLILEGIKSYSLPASVLKDHRFRYTNVSMITNLLEKYDGVIVLASHYNNWEWGATIVNQAIPHNCIGFYMPLSHPLIDKFMLEKRTRFGTRAYPSIKSLRIINSEKNNKPVFFLVADQSPSNLNKVEWIDFLHRKTAFLVGPEKIAIKNNYPVVYIDIQKVKRGFYKAQFELLVEHPKDTLPGEITRIYARHLEQKIKENPIPWLWSHRRWKHKFKTQ